MITTTWQMILIQCIGSWLIGNAIIMVFLLKCHLNWLDRERRRR